MMEQPNYSTINKLANGDESIKKMIFDVIIEEFPLEKEAYYKSILAKDAAKTKEHVHKIKHKISVLGLEKSYELANIYENNLLNSSIENHKDFEKTLEVISSFIKSIS